MFITPAEVGFVDAIHTHVCVIGSGPAGIALALELGNRGLQVTLVTGGGLTERLEDRKLYEGIVDPPESHESLQEGRLRALGGGTKIWGGRLVPFDEIDFEARPHVPLVGWPIGYEAIAGHVARATELCQGGTPTYQHEPKDQADLPASFGDDDSITTTSCERWSVPTDFGEHYRPALDSMSNVRVLLDYHCVDLRMRDGLEVVETARLMSRYGPEIKVVAETFVLAAGGIENARLLLASRSHIADGIGNHSKMVGRCYMAHLSGIHGRLKLRGPRKPDFYRMHSDADGTYYRRRFRLSHTAQRRYETLNIIGFPFRPPLEDPQHKDAVLSLMYLRSALPALVSGTAVDRGDLARHLRNIVVANPLAWSSTVRQLWGRRRTPRWPFVTPYRPSAQDALFFQSEHGPNLESRIVLTEAWDEFGVPRICAQPRFTELDLHTVRVFYRELDQALRNSDLGLLEYEPDALSGLLESLTGRFDSNAHHLGTTRMSASPSNGVVDTNCRVHSVKNLYIAGASVFSTGGHANPTLMIVALTLRLSAHLSSVHHSDRVR